MLREGWYVACAASQLGEGPRSVRVLDQDLVVFRDGGGCSRALLDRCCHRGVKLSLGRITDGSIACGYHGWQYDGTGRCVLVPSLPMSAAIPRALAVPSFPCVEQDSYVWVWMGEGEPMPSSPSRIEHLEDYAWTQGVSPMRCSATMLIENQFDTAHPAFAHAGTHPSYFLSRVTGRQEYSFEVRTTEEGMVAFYPITESDQDPIPSEYKTLTRFELPSRVYIHQRILKMEFFVLVHIVPTGEGSCRMEWLQRGKKRASGITWVDQEPKLIEQDRLLLESAQPSYDAGDAFERSVGADRVTVMVRRVVALAASGRWHEDRGKLPQRLIVHLRS